MKILKSKLFKILIIMFLIGILFGIVSYFLMDNNEINIIKNDLINYITNIKNDNLNYTKGLFNSIVLNLKYNSLIWIAGIIFVLIFLVPVIIIYNGLLFSFTTISLISTFHLKGILYALIIAIPNIINSFIILLLSYYSINFSLKCYKYIKYNKYINLKEFIKNYSLIYIILSTISILNSLVEIYLTSNLLKFVV